MQVWRQRETEAERAVRLEMEETARRKEEAARQEKEEREAEERARREAERAERERLRSLPPLYVIHTVHGTRLTFTRKAKWVEPGSPFCTSLNELLGLRARFVPLDWGGKNSVQARWDGSVKLLTQLEEQRKEHEYADHFVVGHSHGGNVALMALDSEPAAKKVRGVATLATPFLSARVNKGRELLDPGAGRHGRFLRILQGTQYPMVR